MSIIPFAYEGGEVRVVTRSGEPWFVLADVCRVLEIGNPSDAAKRLDDDERGTLDTIEGANFNGLAAGAPMPTIITESGLYSLILTSRKDAAKRFKKWVTAEVLPAIRKTGGYLAAAPDETPEQLALRALTVLQATVERQKRQLAETVPKAQALDRIATASAGSVCVTDAAKALAMKPKDLFTYLVQNGWLYRRPGGKGYLGYQTRTIAGDLEHKVNTVLRSDGSEKMVEHVLVTPQGLAKLANLIKPLKLVV